MLKLGNTHSSIAYQSANGRTLWCLSKLQMHLPFKNPTSGDRPTYVKKINKGKCIRFFTAALLVITIQVYSKGMIKHQVIHIGKKRRIVIRCWWD